MNFYMLVEGKSTEMKVYPKWIDGVEFSIILQTMCIETWFLGNRKEFPTKYSDDFKKFVSYYNVSLLDPEEMREPEDEGSIGKYSKKYLKRMLAENRKTYSVSKVDSVTAKEYIKGVEERFENTSHIKSCRYFKEFIESIS